MWHVHSNISESDVECDDIFVKPLFERLYKEKGLEPAMKLLELTVLSRIYHELYDIGKSLQEMGGA